MKDYLNRAVYAKEIIEEIDDRYKSEIQAEQLDKNHKRENIVFAISGKWGEGKTGILDLMEKPLKVKGYTVIRFNPWKYSQEGISLKRAFLKNIRNELNPEVNLDELYYDKTQVEINWKGLAPKWVTDNLPFILAVIILFFIIDSVSYFSKTLWVKDHLNSIATWILLPTLATFLLKIISTENKSAKVTTAEEFEDKFNEILDGKEKIVIFIDDLDRCSPETIKTILDALRTFFLHPECSFVITGDHTIIERYAINEIKLNGEDPQKERAEGRRFLKKLFDVYWRVPFPTPYQFKVFVENEIKNSKIDFTEDNSLINFTTLLTSDGFFERNLRHVKRFITKLRFTLEGVKLQIKQLDEDLKKEQDTMLEDSKKSLQKIIKNPDLLAKVLLIEESFYTLYEWLVVNPHLIIEHERSLRRRLNPEETFLDKKTLNYFNLKKEILDENLYELLVNSSPKFTNEQNTVIHNAATYFLVSGSTGLPSNLGPDEANFTEYIKNGRLIELLGDSLKDTPPDRNKEFAKQAIKMYRDTLDVEEPQKIERLNIITASLKLSASIKEWAEELDSWEEEICKLLPEEHEETFKLFFQSLFLQRPDILIKIKKERPELFPIVWKSIPDTKVNDWNKDTKDILRKIADDALATYNEDNSVKTDLPLVEAYLSTDLKLDLIKEINEETETLEDIEFYIDELKKIGLTEGNFVSLIKERFENELKNMKYLDKIISEKSNIEGWTNFLNIQSYLIEIKKTDEELIKLVKERGTLGFTEAQNTILEKEATLRILKGNNFSLAMDSADIQPFLTKDSKIKIFNKITEVGVYNKMPAGNDKEKLLSHENTLWNGVAESDITASLDLLQKKNKKKKGKLGEYDHILESWGRTVTAPS